jgi:glyoxylase-like metal-dependent hydrolase (beta-lactamase superfamily II)
MLKLDLAEGLLLCFSGRFLSSNIYVVEVGNQAIAVDAGLPWSGNRVRDYPTAHHLKLDYIFLTHSHFDHIMGLGRFRQAQTKVVGHARNKRCEVEVEDGDVIEAVDCALSFLVLYTGLHNADHVWYYERRNKLLFVGDQPTTMSELTIMGKKYRVEPGILLPGHGDPGFL